MHLVEVCTVWQPDPGYMLTVLLRKTWGRYCQSKRKNTWVGKYAVRYLIPTSYWHSINWHRHAICHRLAATYWHIKVSTVFNSPYLLGGPAHTREFFTPWNSVHLIIDGMLIDSHIHNVISSLHIQIIQIWKICLVTFIAVAWFCKFSFSSLQWRR
jgi:hypothetical protein